MSEQLEAAEALLATVQAGRTRLAMLAHRALPFGRALQLEIAYRVGNSPERILLETPRSTRELAPPAVGGTGSDASAPVEPAPPAARGPATDGPDPDEEPTRLGSAAAVAAAAALASGVGLASSEEEDEPLELDLDDDTQDPALEEPTIPGRSTAQLSQTGLSEIPSSDDLGLDAPLSDDALSDDISLDDLVHEDLPPATEPMGLGLSLEAHEDEDEDEDEDDELIIEEPTEDEESEFSPTSVSTASPALRAAIAAQRRRGLIDDDNEETPAPSPALAGDPAPADDEHEDLATTVADSPPELRAALARERLGDGGGSPFVLAQPRSVGPRVGGAPPPTTPGVAVADPSRPSARPTVSLRPGPSEPGGLEVIERGSEPVRPEPVGAAAIQILGVGKARTLTPTLELGSADQTADDEIPAPDHVESAGGSFSLGFVEPDEEQDSSIPELSAGDDDEDDAPAASILTPDGMVPSASGRVREAAPDDDDVRRFRSAATAAERGGDLQGAVLAWGDVLDLRPSDTEAHLGRGRALVELRDYAAAMSDFQRAEDLSPESALPLFEMGNLFFARMEYSKAIPFFDQAIEMQESHAMSWCRRGISHHHRKNHTQAVADLQRAAALDPDIPGLRRYVQMAIKAMQKRRR